MVATALTPADLQQLLAFEGYGVADPKHIFIGVEELVDAAGILVNLHVRATRFGRPRYDKNLALRDLAAAYREARLAADTYVCASFPGGNVRTWDFAAMVVAALRGRLPCTDDGPWRRAWRSEYEQLGTYRGDSLLAHLYPLPNPGTGEWPPAYASLPAPFQYGDANQYYQAVWPIGRGSARRAIVERCVTRLTREHTVICYGRGSGGEFWDRYAELLGVDTWRVVIPNLVEVATHPSGAALARIGLPWGRHLASRITDVHLPVLVNALAEARSY